MFKYGCRIQDQNVMDDIFMTCVAIYNQRFMQEGGDEPWDKLTAEYNDEVEEGDEADVFERMKYLHRNVPQGTVGLPAGYVLAEDNDVQENEADASYAVRRQQLIDNFDYLYRNDRIVWPRKTGKSYLYRPNDHN